MVNKLALRVVLLFAAVVVVAAACGSSDEPTSNGYVFEPANEPGPDAFTPSVAIEDQTTENSQGVIVPAAQTPVCDKELLKQELAERPDAKKAWAEVEGISVDEVDAYIDTLVPVRLTEATNVTNHGLRDGTTAYPRLSTLEAGTAVLYRPDGAPTNSVAVPAVFSRSGIRAQDDPSPSPSGSYYPGADDTPVTRCKCGNPLLPPTYPEGTPPPNYWESPSPTPSYDPSPSPFGSPSPDPSGSPTDEPSSDGEPSPDGDGDPSDGSTSDGEGSTSDGTDSGTDSGTDNS